MGIAENKQIVRAFYEASNRGGMEGCLALLADDVKWTNMDLHDTRAPTLVRPISSLSSSVQYSAS